MFSWHWKGKMSIWDKTLNLVISVNFRNEIPIFLGGPGGPLPRKFFCQIFSQIFCFSYLGKVRKFQKREGLKKNYETYNRSERKQFFASKYVLFYYLSLPVNICHNLSLSVTICHYIKLSVIWYYLSQSVTLCYYQSLSETISPYLSLSVTICNYL